MKRQEAVNATLSPQQLEHLWAEHIKGEFESKDVEATLATMVEDAYVNHMPVNTGGRGKMLCGLSIAMTSFLHGLRTYR
jgi:carboxymethylenebutenolidase